MHYNVLVNSDYNKSQYIHIPDKWWIFSNFVSAFLRLNAENGAMPLNPRPKCLLYVVFSVLYEFFVLWYFIFLISFLFLFACCMMCIIALSFFNFLFSAFCKWPNLSNLPILSLCCITVLYKPHFVLERVVNFLSAFCINMLYICCISSKEKNHLITRKMKPEEQFKSTQRNILKLIASQYSLLLVNGILDNYMTLTMKIFMSHMKPNHNWQQKKRNSRNNHSKRLKRTKLCLAHNVLQLEKNRDQRNKISWSLGKINWRHNWRKKKKVFVLHFPPVLNYFLLYFCVIWCVLLSVLYKPVHVLCVL